MLAHVPSFGRNPRGSPDFLAYPVPKACMHVLGTRVPRRLGVARSASSPKAAQALGCSLTPGLRISFGRVTCMARAASVPGLWALGFLLLACVCGWVRVAVGRGFCLPLPVVAGVLGGCVWARFVVLSLFCRLFVVFVVGLWCGPAFGTCVVSCAFPLPPAVSGSGVRCGRPGLGCAPPFLAGLSGCVFCAFFSFFPVAGCPCPGPCGLSPVSFLSGTAGFFFFFLLVSVSLFSAGPLSLAWCCRSWLGGPPVPVWGSCLRCPLGGGFGGCGLFSRAPPPPFFFFFFRGGGACRAVPPVAFPRLAVALWLVCDVVGPSPLLAEVPVCYSPPLLAGFRCRWLWAVPATPGWGLPAAVVSGVWRWCVGGVVAGVWCGWSLATPGGGSCVLLPATPGWVSLPVVLGGPRHSWLGSVGGVAVWCVVCGGGVLVGLWLVCGVVGPSPLLAEVPVCYSPPLLAGFRCRWWWAVPATPGWGPLAAVVCGVWCVVCGGGVWVGLWLVCGVVGPSPLLAEVPVCYSPPLLAGFRFPWWWAVPATPGWGPLAALLCGVWCVAVVCWWGCGWCVVWLVPRHSWRRFLCATPRHSWLGFAAGGGGRSPPLLAGVRLRRWCVVCGVWCVAVVCWWGCGWCVVWLVPRHSWRRFLCATPRHSWLGFAAGGGGRSPPLLAGVRWRRCCVVCGVWRWCVGGVVAGVWCGWSLATPGGGSCVLLPATPGWVSLPVVVGGPRHSWLGSACGGGVWCVVCGVWRWCVGGVVAGVWCGWSLATPGGGSCVLLPATPGWVSLPVVVGGPRHSWLGSAFARVVCGVWCVVCGGGVLVGLWLVCGVVGPSPLLAEVPVCYSPPLLAGFRCRWWWAVPATPGWGPLAAVVCGVLLGSLAAPGGGSCVLLPATPGWVSLPLVVGGPRHSWLGSSGGGGVRVLLGRVGRAGLPGALWCASPFPLAALSFCFAWPPPGWGCPPLLRCCCRSSLAGVCGVWVGCCLAPVRVPWFFACCARSPGLWHPAAFAAWHLSVCRGCGRRRASLACLVAPRGAPRLVRSGRSRCSGRLSRRRGAFPHPGSLRPRLYWAAARGTRRPAENRAHCACRWLPPRQGRWALRVVPVRGPAMGLSLAGPSGVGLGLRALRWLACADPVTDASGFPYRPSFDGGLGRCTGAVSCGRRHLPLRVGGRHARVPCVFACACFPGRVGRAGLPGAFWCASPFPLAALSFCFAWPPPGWGCPSLFRCCCLSSLVAFLGLPLLGSRLVCVLRLAVGCSLVVAPPPRPPLCLGFSSPACGLVFFFFFFFFSFFLRAPPLSPAFSGFRPRVPWASALALFVLLAFRFSALRASVPLSCFPLGCWLLPRGCCPPPPPLCPAVFVPAARCCVPCRAVRPPVRCGAAPRCCALCRPVLCWRVLCCARLVPLLVAPCPLALPVALGPCALRRCVLRCSPATCALCVLSWRGGACCAFPVLSVLCGAVLRCAGASALCCSCGACCCWRLVLWCAAVCCAVSCGVPWCGAGSGGPWLSAGGVFQCRCPCLAAWSASLGLVWFAVVPCFPVSCSVVLCCRVVLWCCALLSCCGAVGACFALLWAVVLCCVVLLVGCAVFGPVVVSACCGALFLALCVPCLLRSVRCGALLCWLWCPASLCRVLCRCAVVWCCAVVPCCRFAVLFVFALPSCGLSCGACVVCAVVGASCCGVSLCVVVSPWAFCGVVVLLWCVVVSCCAVRCPVVSCALCRVLRCRAVLRCCAGWLCCAVVCAAGVCFVLLSFDKNPCRFSVPLKTLFFFFFFENKIKLYTTQHTRVQQDHVRGCALRVTRRS